MFEIVDDIKILQLSSTCKVDEDEAQYCNWGFCKFPENPSEHSIFDELGLIDILIEIFFELACTFAKDYINIDLHCWILFAICLLLLIKLI